MSQTWKISIFLLSALISMDCFAKNIKLIINPCLPQIFLQGALCISQLTQGNTALSNSFKLPGRTTTNIRFPLIVVGPIAIENNIHIDARPNIKEEITLAHPLGTDTILVETDINTTEIGIKTDIITSEITTEPDETHIQIETNDATIENNLATEVRNAETIIDVDKDNIIIHSTTDISYNHIKHDTHGHANDHSSSAEKCTLGGGVAICLKTNNEINHKKIKSDTKVETNSFTIHKKVDTGVPKVIVDKEQTTLVDIKTGTTIKNNNGVVNTTGTVNNTTKTNMNPNTPANTQTVTPASNATNAITNLPKGAADTVKTVVPVKVP